MNLNRVASKLHKTPVQYWDKALNLWQPSELVGRLEVYDRFISDRSFGQRKRVFLTSPDNELPPHMKVVKLGAIKEPYMVESINHDMSDTYPHLAVHMLQEVPYRADIHKLQGGRRPSGAMADPDKVLVDSTYCNLDRYGNLNAKGVLTVDYTVMSIYVPGDTKVDGDSIIEVEGVTFDVFEVASVMNVLMLRAQKRG